MPHMVIFRSSEGKPGYHQTESLDEAIRFVEHLRNKENVPDARVYLLKEVPLEVRTYVKVEVAGSVADEPRTTGYDGGGDFAPPAAAAAPAPAPNANAAPQASVAPPPQEPAVPASAPAAAPAGGPVQPPGDAQAGVGTARFGRFNRG